MKINKGLAKVICYSAWFSGAIAVLIFGLYHFWERTQSPSMSDASIRKHIQVGMTGEEVKAVLGDQYDGDDDGWIYQNIPPDTHPEASTRIIVIFDDGKVSKLDFVTPIRKASQRVK